jgi:hypothetical protein
MKTYLGTQKYSDLMEVVRTADDQLAVANMVYDTLEELEKGDATVAWKTFRAFCLSRKASAAGNVTKGMGKVEGWLKAVRGAFSQLGGLTDAAKGKLLLAGMKREWEGTKYAKLIKDCANLAGSGDATAVRMADWFYYFAFLWQEPVDLGSIAIAANARVVVQGVGVVWVNIYDNRIKHITDGHTFGYYVFDQEEVGNLERAMDGVQTFWPKDYDWNDVYADVKTALENDAAVKNKLQAGAAGWVNATTPSHIRLSLVRSGTGVYRVSTAFPGNIAQPDTHRIPQTFLKYIYELMAPGLGMATLKSVKSQGVTAFDKAMASAAKNQ